MTQTNPSSTSSPVVVTAVGVTIPPIGRGWRGTLFAINFTTALGLLVLFVLDFAWSTRFPQGLGLVCFGPVVAAYATAEWLGWYRGIVLAETFAGVFCLLVSWLALFAMFTMWYEIEMEGKMWPAGLRWFYIIVCGVAAYGSFCGLWRLSQPWWMPQKTMQDSQKGYKS